MGDRRRLPVDGDWYAHEDHVRANEQSDDKLFQQLPPYVFAFLAGRSVVKARACSTIAPAFFDAHRAVVAFPVNRSISFVRLKAVSLGRVSLRRRISLDATASREPRCVRAVGHDH